MRLTAISDPIRRSEVWKLQDRCGPPPPLPQGGRGATERLGAGQRDWDHMCSGAPSRAPGARQLPQPTHPAPRALFPFPLRRPSLKNIRELLKMRSADTIELEFEPWDGPLPSAGFDGSLVSSGAGSSAPSAGPASVLSSMDGSASSGESLGERLARQYAEAAAAGRTPTAVEARQARRRERMELDDARDDRGFLLGVFALFVIPPLVILLIAQSSGYLDNLYLNTLTRVS